MYRRGDGTWDSYELVDNYVEVAKTQMDDNPVETYGNSLLKSFVEFNNWKQNLEFGIGILNDYNSHCKLVIETEESSYSTQYQMFILYLVDQPTLVDDKEEDVKGENPNGGGGITFGRGKNTIEITFSEKNIEIVKQRGIYIIIPNKFIK